MREIIFDTETTGLSPQAGHRVFEIGMVELINRVPTGQTFHHFLDPEQEISEESTRITGITNEDVRGKPTFKDIVADLLTFIQADTLVAHNASFDMNFLNFEMELTGHGELKNNVVDTLAVARKKLPGSRHSLDALCKRFNVTLHAERDVHGALLDAQLLAEVYIELTGGLQETLVLEAETQQQETGQTALKATLNRPPLILQPNEAEFANMQAWQGKVSS